ncbi:MAG: hypothetical protein A3K19_07595 [Lentisphaerae bacterium RIFOXYB12_FULL_65_16]|nr:MAG: hypothetical protein A3K18_05210 [Lentisphaerae bacterium RIFOXYA12_64_32]OGV93402.1 MAG: hypothetical protein A3K19_07595 [Lentisphaerae bacterium RIFOXYB12_FULL_65_16]
MLRHMLCAAVLGIASLVQSGWTADVAVAEFGAIPNDDVDDAAAINSAVAKAQPGDTVTIPDGTFLLADTVVLKTGITLKGAGQGVACLVFSGDKPHCLVRMQEAENVEVTGMTLDGGNNPKAQQGIVGPKCNALRLHHLTIQNFVDTGAFGPHAILCSGTSNSMISDNTILNMAPDDEWGAGIRMSESCSGNRIERNIIHNTGRGGIFTNNGATDMVISENIITGSHGITFAIEVHSGSVRTVIEDNIVDHGLSIVSANCAIRRNIVVDPTGTWGTYGIEGGGGPEGVVTGNVIDYGQGQGISLSGASHHMLWARNSFSNCSQWGIQMQGPALDNKIRCLYFYDNTFRKMKKGHPSARYPGHDGHAIRFNNNTEYVVFDSNRIMDNAGLGVQLTSGEGINNICFINNLITNNAQGSINQYPSAPVIWENNLVSGNGANTQLQTQGFTGEPPVPSFSCPDTARVGVPVQFQSTSAAPGSEIDHVLWDFDAGVPVMAPNPTYTYQRAGAYRVSLIVWNKDGRGARPAEKVIRVSAE